jgi:hypothetical protein
MLLTMDDFGPRMRELTAPAVQRFLSTHLIAPASIERFLRCEASRYTRHLVFRSSAVEILYELTRSERLRAWRILGCGAVSHGLSTAYLPLVELLRRAFDVSRMGTGERRWIGLRPGPPGRAR